MDLEAAELLDAPRAMKPDVATLSRPVIGGEPQG